MEAAPKDHRSTDSGDLRRKIPAWLAGDLDERALRAFEEALAGDAALRAETGGLRVLWEDLPDRAPEGAPVDYWPIVREQLPAGKTTPFPVPASNWRMAASFAAGIIAGLGLWLLATGGPATSLAAEEELLAHDTIMETLDPIPYTSMGGVWLAALPLDEEGDR